MRSARTLLAVLALLLLVAGTALATRSDLDSGRSPLAASNQASSSEKEETTESSESEGSESETPESPDTQANTNRAESGAQLTDAHVDELVARLKDAGITATASDVKTLAAKYGVGGAVRLLAWAEATGKTVAELGAMFDGGMGWGAIAHQLEKADSSLDLSPGIGWIMGNGHNNKAAKQAKGHGSTK